jgi:hypothetical protein
MRDAQFGANDRITPRRSEHIFYVLALRWLWSRAKAWRMNLPVPVELKAFKSQ